jgi:hypothetical protein
LASTKPIQIVTGPVAFPDGTPVLPEHAGANAGFRLYRRTGAGPAEAWDAERKQWVPERPAPAPEQLFFNEGSWQALLMPIGAKDAGGRDKFDLDLPAARYSVELVFSAARPDQPQQSGTSPRSDAIGLVKAGEDNKVGVAINKKDPKDATEIKLFLKDAGLQERGSVAIRAVFGDHELELVCGSARVTMSSAGEIRLEPAAGQTVRIDGVLDIVGNARLNGAQVDTT